MSDVTVILEDRGVWVDYHVICVTRPQEVDPLGNINDGDDVVISISDVTSLNLSQLQALCGPDSANTYRALHEGDAVLSKFSAPLGEIIEGSPAYGSLQDGLLMEREIGPSQEVRTHIFTFLKKQGHVPDDLNLEIREIPALRM